MQAIRSVNLDQLEQETRPVRSWYAGGRRTAFFGRVSFACEHPYDLPADISGLIGCKYRGIGKKGWRGAQLTGAEQRSDYDMLGLAYAKGC